MGLPSITSAPQRVSSSGPGFALAEQENSCGLEERKDLVFLLHRNETRGRRSGSVLGGPSSWFTFLLAYLGGFLFS